MTFQNRKTPYRTNDLQEIPSWEGAGVGTPYRTNDLQAPSSSSLLPPGRYTGRVLDIEETEEMWRVCIFLEEHSYQFDTGRNPPFDVGELLVFEVDSQGRWTFIESLFSPVSPLDPNGDAFRWRRLGAAIPRMQRLKQRHQILRHIRSYFDQNGFLEVETPSLVKAPSPESQFIPVATDQDFLITSPEFQMKRMLVGGFEKIYQITSCFRGKEVGRFHNPEFTMLEWYRAYDCLKSLVADLEGIVEMITAISPQVENSYLEAHTARVLLKTPWKRCSVAELFERYLGLDLEGVLVAQQLKEVAIAGGYGALIEEIPDHYEEIFFRLWDHFEHQLGQEAPLLVYDWPLPLASLAQGREDKPGVAERMEFYIAGIELANGFGELTDPVEQKRRFELNLLERQAAGQTPVPLDDAFLESLSQGMPPSAGMALGIDRLVMLFTGASHIREVLCFAADER